MRSGFQSGIIRLTHSEWEVCGVSPVSLPFALIWGKIVEFYVSLCVSWCNLCVVYQFLVEILNISALFL